MIRSLLRSLPGICTLGWLGLSIPAGSVHAEPPTATAVDEKPVAARQSAGKPTGVRVGYTLILWGCEDPVVKALGIEGHKSLGGPYLGTWHDIKGAKAIGKGRLDGLERGEFDMLLVATPHCYPSGESWGGALGLESTPAILATAGSRNNPNFRLVWQTWFWPREESRGSKKMNVASSTRAAAPNADLEKLVADVNEQHGRQVMVVSPAAEAVGDLVTMVAEGKFPGISEPFDLWLSADMWQPGLHIRSLIAYVNAATMYGVSPIGSTPDFSGLAFGGGKGPKGTVADLAPVTDEQRAILQRIAWDAVTRCPVSGVKAAPATP